MFSTLFSTFCAPENILSEAVATASLYTISLEEADAGTGAGRSIFNRVWWFSYVLYPQLWEETQEPH